MPSVFNSPLYEHDAACAANNTIGVPLAHDIPSAPALTSPWWQGAPPSDLCAPDVTASDHAIASPKKEEEEEEENWDEQLARSLPFSVAILSSDACQVLHHKPGTEPEAAQLLQDVLNPCTVHRSHGSAPPSILDRLLGPGLEAEAIQALALGRPWKGSVTSSARSRNSLSNSSSLPKKVRWSHTHEDVTQSGSLGSRVPNPSPLRKKSSVRIEPPVSEAPEADPVSLENNVTTCPELIIGSCNENKGGFLSAALQADRLSCNEEADSGAIARSKQPPRKSKSFSLGTPKRRASSLCMPEEAVDRMLSGASSEECSRTKSLLKGLSRSQARSSERGSSTNLRSDCSLVSSPGVMSRVFEAVQPLEVASEGWPKPNMPKLHSVSSNLVKDLDGPKTSKEAENTSSWVSPFADSTGYNSASLPKAGGLHRDSDAGWDVDEASQSNSFDISITQLKCPKRAQAPPLLVAIYNSSEHRRARAVLSSLAESQLELLSDIMPEHAIQFLSMESREAVPANIGKLAHGHKGATLLFMDLCGFTAFSKSVEPVQVMHLLNNLFSAFDELTEQCRVHKLETAGDCYLVSGGIMAPDPSPNGFATVLAEQQDPALAAKRVMNFAIKALQVASMIEMPGTGSPVRMRVGIHTGDCVSGLIGTKLPKFSCFGDAMNVASRMESTGVPGRIHVSEATYKLLQHEKWAWEPTGGVEVKGKGRMLTYLWNPLLGSSSEPPLPTVTTQTACQYGHLQQACSLMQHVKSPCCSSEPLPCNKTAQAAGG